MHFHWLIWAHNGTQETHLPGGHTNVTYVDVVEVDIIADHEDAAIDRAMMLAPERLGYLLKKVSQHEEHV